MTEREYHTVSDLAEKHLDTLRQELSQAQVERLDKLCDAWWEQRDMELEAMFRDVWAAVRELA